MKLDKGSLSKHNHFDNSTNSFVEFIKMSPQVNPAYKDETNKVYFNIIYVNIKKQ